jgi:hypothetical protein
MLASFCDVFILLCLVTDFYPRLSLVVVYTHLFVFLRALIKKIDGKSNVAVILEVFVAHVYTYAKALIFVLLFVLGMAFAAVPFFEGGDSRGTTSVELFGILICIAFDTEWVLIIQEVYKLAPRMTELKRTLLTWGLYASQVFMKQILFQLFTSVVISSKPTSENRLPTISSHQ